VPYWELKATLEQDGEPFEVAHAKGRFDSLEAMEAARERARVETAEVAAYKAEPRQDKPPAPFNTTALMSAASGAGLTPARAMRAAESLYLDGLISYPRTDNTVYPPSLDLRGSLRELSHWQPGAATATRLAGQDKLTPTRGKKRTTDHPPIYPVGVPSRQLSGDQAKVYDLVARRFLATLLPPAVIERQRVDLRLGEEPFLAYGARVAALGYLEVYEKYAAKRDRPLPSLRPGETLKVLDLRSEAKETQPPGRYGQGKLIEKMEELGLGTKATRADIIQHLYDRNYVRDNPVEPTELGMALIGAFDAAMEKAPVDISSSEMTSTLEHQMDRISEGELRRDEVVRESQDMLEQAWKLLDAHVADIRDRIKSGVREDLTLGECRNCGGQLRVLRGKTGKRFAACVGKEGEEPSPPPAEGGRPRRGCGQTFPLPQRGTIVPTGKACGDCGWPEIRVVGGGGRGRPWVLCIDIDCPSKEKYRSRKRAG
jgi:DNA topoisomerase-1